MDYFNNYIFQQQQSYEIYLHTLKNDMTNTESIFEKLVDNVFISEEMINITCHGEKFT